MCESKTTESSANESKNVAGAGSVDLGRSAEYVIAELERGCGGGYELRLVSSTVNGFMGVCSLGPINVSRSSSPRLAPTACLVESQVQRLMDQIWQMGVRPSDCRCHEQGTMEIVAGMGLKAGQPVYAYGDEDSVRREMEAKNRIIEGLRRVIDVLAEKIGGGA